MKSKAASTTLSLLILVAIILVVNYIVGGLGFLNSRADLTEKKIYTLSEGTRKIISRITSDEPVTIRFYASQDSSVMPQWLMNYGRTVKDLLMEMEKEGDGKLKLERIDPKPRTEEEDKAIADDIRGSTLSMGGDKFYLGIAIESVGKKEIIPALDPAQEVSLEYSIARAIAKVTSSEKDRPVVGVMSGMPIAGPAFNFPGMPQQQPPPWVMIQLLRQDYDVREVPTSTESIDADVDVLLVIHPSDITEKAEFAIDQFLLKGGKVLAFVDPHALVSRNYNNQSQLGRAPTFVSDTSNLPKLLKAWGVKYDQNLVVADMEHRTQISRDHLAPTFLSIGGDGINRDEPLTSNLEVVQMISSGAFQVEDKPGIKVTRLVQSSENSQLVDRSTAEKSQSEPMNSFAPDGKRKALALRLTGKFATAFPDGAPKDKAPEENAPRLPGAGETGGEDAKDAGAPAAAVAPAALKESQNDQGMVFLFADVDMEYDIFALQRDRSGRLMQAFGNSNIPLLLNAVEMATGGADLVAVRSRATAKREFTKMNELLAGVEEKYRPIVEKHNAELQKIVEEMAALSSKKQEGNVVILSPTEDQLKQLTKQQTEIQKKVRDAEKELNRERNRLHMIITGLNMAAVPAFLIVVGLLLAIRRRSLQAAH